MYQIGFKQVEHTGSTSVPDLGGKEIIDILVITENILESISTLEGNGFTEKPFKNISETKPLRVCEIEYEDTFFQVHVHLTAPSSSHHKEILLFRDLLKKNIKLQNDKTSLIDYNTHKNDFIKNTIRNTTIKPKQLTHDHKTWISNE